MPVRFFVPGVAAPQGSKSAFPGMKRGGPCRCRRQSADGKPKLKCRKCLGFGTEIEQWVNQTESSKRVGPWRETVANVALRYRGRKFSSRVPLRLVLLFAFCRPPSHFCASGLSKAGRSMPRPQGKTSHGDYEKLARAGGDALTGVLYADDADVCSGAQEKYWTAGPGGMYVSVGPAARNAETPATLLSAFGMGVSEAGLDEDDHRLVRVGDAEHGFDPLDDVAVIAAPAPAPQGSLFGDGG